MEYGGKNPNGINQVSQSLLSIDVQGVEQINISTSSVDINTSLNVEGGITASSYSGSFVGDGSELINIPPEALTPEAQSKIFDGSVSASISEEGGFVVNTSASISGGIFATGEISGGFISGDGTGLFNVPAEALGDIDRLKSGSVQAVISPNLGFVVDTNTTINNDLLVTGSTTIQVDGTITRNVSIGNDLKVTGSADIQNDLTIGNDLTIDNDLSVGNNLSVTGRITSQELLTTFISSSVIYASGSNVFGDESTDTHQFTGSVLIKDSVVIPVFSSAPSGGQLGQLYYNTTDTNIYRSVSYTHLTLPTILLV